MIDHDDPTPPAWSDDIFTVNTPSTIPTKEQIYRDLLHRVVQSEDWYKELQDPDYEGHGGSPIEVWENRHGNLIYIIRTLLAD